MFFFKEVLTLIILSQQDITLILTSKIYPTDTCDMHAFNNLQFCRPTDPRVIIVQELPVVKDLNRQFSDLRDLILQNFEGR